MRLQRCDVLAEGFVANRIDADRRPYVTMRARATVDEWAKHEQNVEAALAAMRAVAAPSLYRRAASARVCAATINTIWDSADGVVQINVQFVGLSANAVARIDRGDAAAAIAEFGRGTRAIALED
jgi:hypothetical protein